MAVAGRTEGRLNIPGYHSPGASSIDSSANHTPNYPSTPLNEPDKQEQQRPELAPTSCPGVAVDDFASKPSSDKFAATGISSVAVDDHYGLHIMLPSSGSTSTVPASITSLDHCIVDMSIPTANGKPYASLTAKDVKGSLLVCGQVNGPAHVTGVERSVMVVSCRQFRMHNCSNVDVYLSCSSNPIIEDCSNIRFGRIPKAYVSDFSDSFHTTLLTTRFSQALRHDRPDHEDRWSQVEDFKWIKTEPSPNWSLLDPNDAVPEEVWAEIVPGGPGWSLEDILQAIKVMKN